MNLRIITEKYLVESAIRFPQSPCYGKCPSQRPPVSVGVKNKEVALSF